MKKYLWIIILVIVALFLFKKLRKNDHTILLQKYEFISEKLSKNQGEGIVQTANKLSDLIVIFSYPLELKLLLKSEVTNEIYIKNQQEIKDIILMVKAKYPVLELQFEDIKIDLRGDYATVEANAKLIYKDSTGQKLYDLYETRVDWKKVDKDWQIFQASLNYNMDATK